MKKKHIIGLLTLGAMLMLCPVSQAATSATQTLQATLGSFVNITPDGTAVTTTTIDSDTGALTTPLTSIFDIQANQATPLYLTANAVNQTTNDLAFYESGSNVYVILANTTNVPLQTAFTDIRSGSPTPANNANAIAYQVTGVVLTGSTTTTPVFNSGTSQYNMTVNAGDTTATTTISTTVAPNTYSYLDTAGTYQAIVTLSTSPT